uniref:Highly reducing polyketide synthase ACRTS2 n=1 Tax=Alternaria alternata TaxID=5599 RepID=ACRS2_ALTAL|nr:RecName: Full=Highly reducing polyketide synthase ACRTS2; Short=HR-PKS ACRTS2; AltName: Full=ACR-toxin biosynthesis protein S2 [Alternaria alternata]BAN19720.1 polyketide synthase [Alternaria alternata]
MEKDTPVAIIGVSYRAPGIGGKGLWDYLAEAKSAWTKVPPERFEHFAWYKAGEKKTGVFANEGAHFVDNVFDFDAAFFNMRADEARCADPSHRFMLEVALEAAENAGQSLLDLSGKKIGVFVGAGQHEYSHRVSDDEYAIQTFTATGVAPCMAANRLSYFFDIDGPSVVLDAACASSAYAVDMAVKAIRNGDCDGAFVGAAALNLSPSGWLVLDQSGTLSDIGRSFSYDAKASGFGRGEGAACLLIKRLEDAIRDGDPIQALIRGTACSHSGRSEGITMPSRRAQEKLIWDVHNSAGLDPSNTAVVEVFSRGHGTGTAVGDPIEAGAFTSVLARNRTAANPIYIGSLKSNFGHLEGASGVLAMIKAVLMVRNGVVLPTAGFERINEAIDNYEKIKVPTTPLPWPENEPRRCLVTNFGFGGSSSAVIIDRSPYLHALDGYEDLADIKIPRLNGSSGRSESGSGQSQRLFVFSAKTRDSLTAYLASFHEYLLKAQESHEFLKDLSYTLGQRRTHHAYRASVVANSISDLRKEIPNLKPSKIRQRSVIFVFTGQGAQYARMAYNLRQFTVFAETLEKAETQLNKMGASWSLTEELNKLTDTRINDAEISQPACTAVQLAMVALLQSWGVVPNMVTGHSSGEIAAAFTAGLLTFQEAIAISYFRGQSAVQLSAAQHEYKKGAMLALGVGSEDALKIIDEHAQGYATVAAINSPRSVTISGDKTAIENVRKAADMQGLFARMLKVEVAYHSRHMEQVAASYLKDIEPYFQGKAIPAENSGACRPVFVSSVTGQIIDAVDSSYWIKNLVQPVLFADAIKEVLTHEDQGKSQSIHGSSKTLVEIGPHAALKNPVKQTAELLSSERAWNLASLNYLPSLLRGTNDVHAILELARALFDLGASVELSGVNGTNKHNARVLTELPSYAWDRSYYELRPRVTHDKQFPGEEYHALIGRKAPSNAAQENTYRQVFTLDEMPWIRDHVVSGVTVFPMTGYMSCAIEAARRVDSAAPAAFLITDFHVVQSLEIHEEETVDLTTKLKPAATGEGTFSSKVWSFEVVSWSEANGWTRHCWGKIEPEIADLTLATPTFEASLPLVTSMAGVIEHDMDNEYHNIELRGTKYGPSFRNNVKFYEGKNYTVLEHRIRDLGDALKIPVYRGSPVSVDPPTLDSFLQGAGPFQYDGSGRRLTQMPDYISRFRISNNITSEPNHRLDVVMRRLDYDDKGGRMHVSVAVFGRGSDDQFTPIAEWESFTFRTVSSADDQSASVPDNWSWELLPRYDLISKDTLRDRLLESVGDLGEEEDVRMSKLDAVGCYYIEKALKDTVTLDYSKLPTHLARFVHWGRNVLKEYEVNFESEPTSLLEDVRNLDAQGELLCLMGENLVDILAGRIEPLEVMLTDGRLMRHYEADVANAHLSKIIGYLTENMADLEPWQRILEIGGGTAGTTLPVLEGLSRNRDEPGCLDYTFTDISSGFFEMASKKLSRWSQQITYKRLDITQDPAMQGFTQESYDVVVAANVLHATADMVTTMTHVRSLLKPGGKLILLEATRHPPWLLPFTLLPDWWAAKDKYRDHKQGPMMPAVVWNDLLLDSGFSGVDVVIPTNYRTDNPLMNVVCSTRIGKQDDSETITICGPLVDDTEVNFAQSVARSISKELGCPTEIKRFADIKPDDESYYILLDSKHESVFQNFNPGKFECLKSLLLRNKGLLWVTAKGCSPDAKMIQGMVRTVRLEVEPKNLMLLDNVPSTPEGLSGILKLAARLRDPEVSRDQDMDFAWHDGAIHLPRMRQLKDLKEQFSVEEGVAFRRTQNLRDNSDRGLEMTIQAAGSPDTIYFRRTDPYEVSEDEVLVRVEAAGVGHRDFEVLMGSIPWAPPGYEGAGKVLKIGSQVSHLREGDDVFFLTPEASAFATEVKLASWLVARIPKNMTVTDAAACPLGYCLATLAFRTARLTKNETVLIHSAASSVGQACILLAQDIGARIYVTAGTEDKRDYLHQALGIPRDHIFSSRTAEFRDSLLCKTNNRGVDVVVNSLSGELLTETWAVIAAFGRFVEIGKKDAFLNNSLPMRPFNNNVTLSAIDLRDLYHHRPDDVRSVWNEVVNLLQRKQVRPVDSASVVSISHFSAALRILRSRDHIGRLVVTLGDDNSVMAETALRPSQVSLKDDATYLVAGGTRGIGLDLAYWMIEHGARNIVLLGRSGASGPEAQKILNKFRNTKVCVRAVACNVGDRDELQNALESIKDLPAIRGVVHSALLLSDKLFVNASYEDWVINTTPRVAGAWNLDDLLPTDLDFFVALSSFNGDTGHTGQAIYAGTAGFYNAFSQYRNNRGQYTVSIGLPVVLDVGYVADHDLRGGLLNDSLSAGVTMADIRATFNCILLGPSSPFVRNGRASTFKVYINGQPVQDVTWNYFHPAHSKVRLTNANRNKVKATSGGAEISSASWTTAEDPLTGLIEALIAKVSAMTMMEREDVLPDAPLASYSLDSLVSVELRNWIRRETTAEMTLVSITKAENLRALAVNILAQRKAG